MTKAYEPFIKKNISAERGGSDGGPTFSYFGWQGRLEGTFVTLVHTAQVASWEET